MKLKDHKEFIRSYAICIAGALGLAGLILGGVVTVSWLWVIFIALFPAELLLATYGLAFTLKFFIEFIYSTTDKIEAKKSAQLIKKREKQKQFNLAKSNQEIQIEQTHSLDERPNIINTMNGTETVVPVSEDEISHEAQQPSMTREEILAELKLIDESPETLCQQNIQTKKGYEKVMRPLNIQK